jgi:hypothetical protein
VPLIRSGRLSPTYVGPRPVSRGPRRQVRFVCGGWSCRGGWIDRQGTLAARQPLVNLTKLPTERRHRDLHIRIVRPVGQRLFGNLLGLSKPPGVQQSPEPRVEGRSIRRIKHYITLSSPRASVPISGNHATNLTPRTLQDCPLTDHRVYILPPGDVRTFFTSSRARFARRRPRRCLRPALPFRANALRAGGRGAAGWGTAGSPDRSQGPQLVVSPALSLNQ